MRFDTFDTDTTRSADDKLGFGKHRAKTWNEVLRDDPGYLIWLSNSDFGRSDSSIVEVLNSLYQVDLSLADDQQAAVDHFRAACIEGDERCFRLVGGAGYGKSYAVTAAAQIAKGAGYVITGMATSYVATQVMAESLDPLGIGSKTIARALGLKPNKDSYKESYGPSEDTPYLASRLMENGSMLVVDEYSMTDDETARIVYDAMEGTNSRLMVVGDSCQLPSPAQTFMSAFDLITPMSELTIPKRFAPDSTLHRVEMGVRADPWGMNAVLQQQGDGQSVIHHRSKLDLVNQQIEDMEQYPQDTSLMLFYRRAQVAEANRFIRGSVYGQDAEDIVEGERLRVMRTTFMPTFFDTEKDKWENERFYSGTFLKAGDPQKTEIRVYFDTPDLPFNGLEALTVECFEINAGIPVVFSQSEHSADPAMTGGKSFNTALQRVKQFCIDNQDEIRGVWKLYHHFRSCFLQISYAYATTVHRSQGASVDRIYLSPKDVLQGGDYIARRLAYVAATRARKQLHFTTQ